MLKSVAALLLAALVAGGCSSASVPIDDVPPLPETTPEALRTLLAESERPIVLNIWASWCAPCRSEAPLLRDAEARHGDRVRFIGIDVEDAQDAARAFIAEFGLHDFEHYFDRPGAIPAELEGRGVPLTYFIAPGGEIIDLHRGVIDERTLALGIDELLTRDG